MHREANYCAKRKATTHLEKKGQQKKRNNCSWLNTPNGQEEAEAVRNGDVRSAAIKMANELAKSGFGKGHRQGAI